MQPGDLGIPRQRDLVPGASPHAGACAAERDDALPILRIAKDQERGAGALGGEPLAELGGGRGVRSERIRGHAPSIYVADVVRSGLGSRRLGRGSRMKRVEIVSSRWSTPSAMKNAVAAPSSVKPRTNGAAISAIASR